VVYCLILEPTENCKLINPQFNLLEFRRVGMATTQGWNGFWGTDDWREPLLQNCEELDLI
jgi:hypothetical protein